MPQLFLASTPATAHARRLLRMRALDLHARLSRINDEPCVGMLNMEHDESVIDLVLLRPRSVLVGMLKEVDTPLDIRRDHPWLAEARAARAAVLQLLEQSATFSPAQFGTPIAAVIVVPAVHAESQIVLDVEDHRQRVKVLGLNELAPLAAMLQAGAQLDQAAMEQIGEQLGGRLWHNGERLQFELGLVPYELRVLSNGGQRYPLIEGANILGRRTTPLQYEYRLAFSGDDSISADHAILICAPDGRVVLRDTSTNGSYIRAMDGGEERLHRSERALSPGTILRIGETLLRLEQKSEARSEETE